MYWHDVVFFFLGTLSLFLMDEAEELLRATFEFLRRSRVEDALDCMLYIICGTTVLLKCLTMLSIIPVFQKWIFISIKIMPRLQ